MATRPKRKKTTARDSIIETLEAEPPLIDDVHREEIEFHYSEREPIRKTLLNTLKRSGADLLELSRNGTLEEVRSFAAFADDGPVYAEILRHVATLIETASDRIRQAIELRDDAAEVFAFSKAQLRKGSRRDAFSVNIQASKKLWLHRLTY